MVGLLELPEENFRGKIKEEDENHDLERGSRSCLCAFLFSLSSQLMPLSERQ
jgi:hypothetical protein